MYRTIIGLVMLCVLVGARIGSAGVIYVPGDYSNIQDAVHAAGDGDTVLVAAGLYRGNGNRDVSFMGKAITVRSASGPESCILDAEGAGRGFIFSSGEGDKSVLLGFTIMNGFAEGGGGIYIGGGCSPVITGCRVIGNKSEFGNGGGIYVGPYSSPLIADCEISGNRTDFADGGGLYFDNESSAQISNCTVSNNYSNSGGGFFAGMLAAPRLDRLRIMRNFSEGPGGGAAIVLGASSVITNTLFAMNVSEGGGGAIYSSSFSAPVIVNTTIAGNSASEAAARDWGGAMLFEEGAAANIANSIFWDNSPDEVSALEGASMVISNSLIGGSSAGNGNIVGDPAFFPGTYHLRPSSPCIDSGADSPAIQHSDLSGRKRVLDGNGDGVARIDIGAQEFDPANIVGDIEGLVGDYYMSILDREPDGQGVAFWLSESARTAAMGIDPAETLRGLGWIFFNSEEYLNSGKSQRAYVVDLYETYLMRNPSEAEIAYWIGVMNLGLSRNAMIMNFVYSYEFLRLMDELIGSIPVNPENNILNDFYRGLLRRLPDSIGFQHWLAVIGEAGCQGTDAVKAVFKDIAHQFIMSAEYASRKAGDEEFVEDLYNSVLRRAPEPAGFQYWVGKLRSGSITRVQLIDLFLASEEFEGRIALLNGVGCGK